MVRVYSEVQLAPKTLRQAEQEAVRIFHQTAIETTWVECQISVPATDPRRHLAPDGKHLVMRIVPKAPTAADSIFGMAFLSESDGRGVYTDVFFNSVQRLHQECGASVSRVLGHVMAHEVGHLQLGTKAHAAIGIMRPRRYGEPLAAISKGALRALKHSSLTLRQAFQRRSTARASYPQAQ